MMKDFPLRKWVIRVSLLIVYAAAAVILFVTGRDIRSSWTIRPIPTGPIQR
jgi:hypothetical protein